MINANNTQRSINPATTDNTNPALAPIAAPIPFAYLPRINAQKIIMIAANAKSCVVLSFTPQQAIEFLKF